MASEPDNNIQNVSELSKLERNLILAYQIGSEIGHPELIQAIMLQETKGGSTSLVGSKHASVNNRSYGIMQIQPNTAKQVINNHPDIKSSYFSASSITTSSIISLLLHNDEACIRIATAHMYDLMQMTKGNWIKAIASYNLGIGGAKNKNVNRLPYVIGIKRQLYSHVKPFNDANVDILNNLK